MRNIIIGLLGVGLVLSTTGFGHNMQPNSGVISSTAKTAQLGLQVMNGTQIRNITANPVLMATPNGVKRVMSSDTVVITSNFPPGKSEKKFVPITRAYEIFRR